MLPSRAAIEEAFMQQAAQDGTVDLPGAFRVVRGLKMDVVTDQVRQAFRETDRLKSGKLDKKQCVEMVGSIHRWASRVVGGIVY